MDKGTGVTTAWVPGALKQCWGYPMTHPSHSSFLLLSLPCSGFTAGADPVLGQSSAVTPRLP